MLMKKLKCFFLFVFLWIPIQAFAITDKSQEVSYQKLMDFNLPSGYSIVQGMAVTDKYFVVAAISSGDSKTAILVYDKNTHQLANLKNNPITTYEFGHANDMAYDSKKDEIYIVDGNHLYVLDGKTLEQKTPITLPKTFMAVDVDDNYYYLRDDTTMYIYDKNFKEVSNFNVQTSYARQSIAKYSDSIYYAIYIANGDSTWQTGMNLVYIYSMDGNLTQTLYMKTGYGELEAMEFFDGIPYMLFYSTDGKGVIYQPSFKAISTGFKVGLQLGEDLDVSSFSASLKSGDQVLKTVSASEEGYVFSGLQFNKPGTYQYEVVQLKTDEDIDYDKKVFPVTFTVYYDAMYDKLESVSSMDESFVFTNQYLDRTKLYCAHEDSVYYNPEGDPISQEEYIEVCGTIENPETGSNIPFFVLGMGCLLALGFVTLKKTKFYKL